MAIQIKPKANNTVGTIPSTSDLVDGEFAFNSADRIIYHRVGSDILSYKEQGSVQSVTSASTVTPTASNRALHVTALAANVTVAAPTGSPVDGQKLIMRFKDNGTARTITWNSIYRGVGLSLPSTTTISKTLYVGAVYNVADTKWDVIAVALES